MATDVRIIRLLDQTSINGATLNVQQPVAGAGPREGNHMLEVVVAGAGTLTVGPVKATLSRGTHVVPEGASSANLLTGKGAGTYIVPLDVPPCAGFSLDFTATGSVTVNAWLARA